MSSAGFLLGKFGFFPDIFDASVFNFAFQAGGPVQIAFSDNPGIPLKDIFFQHIFLFGII